MSLYNEDTKTGTYVIVPACYMRKEGWPARHLWRWTHTGKVCDRCGAKITIELPGKENKGVVNDAVDNTSDSTS